MPAPSIAFLSSFAELTRGKMAILISHRELLEHGGQYAELFELQAAGYR